MREIIQTQEAQLPEMIEHIPAVAFRLSQSADSLRTWFVNQNIAAYGYNVEEFMDGSICLLDIVHPGDKVLLKKTVKDYEYQNINAFKLYYRLLTKKGDSVPVTGYTIVNRDRGGHIICYDCFIVSNTENEAGRRLINAHYRQQAVLNDILMSLHDANLDNALHIILDRTGSYLDTSRALLFKDSPDHRTCKIVYEWCNRDIPSVMALDYSITYETGMPEIYIALQTTGNLLINFGEIPENCKEEFEAEGLVASAIFAVYLNGRHYGFVCFDDCVVERVWDDDTVQFLKNIANLISSILARQDAAEKLEQNKKIYETVLDNVDSYIFVTDALSNEIIFANRSFKKAFDEDCIGKNADNYLKINYPKYRLSASNQRQVKSVKINDPEIFSEKTGEWLALSVEEMTWIDGKTVKLINCDNITAKKLFADTLEEKIEERTRQLKLMTAEAERAKEKAEDAALAKSQFLANMSHEIRTPMNAILGLSELLGGGQLNDVQREHVANIRRSSNILLNIINDILDISKLEARRLTLVNINYNLRQTLDHVSSLIRSMAAAKGIEFRFTSGQALDIYLYGDDLRLRQVLINILANAVKFTMEGHVELAVKLDERSVEFHIRDTGIGIKKEDIDFIFEPFSQTDIHRNRNIQGTGLGLPICKNLVELMDGHIKVHSAYGVGSTFIVTIPKIPGEARLMKRETAPAKNLYAPEADILVVDDNEINLYVAEAVLEGYGIKATLAFSGEEALTLLPKKDFDLIFMDHMMPGMDGIETAERIRRLGGKFAAIPIVVLTANVVAEARQMFKEAGMEDFLAKPIEADKLTAILEKWLPKDKIIKK